MCGIVVRSMVLVFRSAFIFFFFFFFFFLFWPCCEVYEILVPDQKLNLGPSKAQGPNRCTTREFPKSAFDSTSDPGLMLSVL